MKRIEYPGIGPEAMSPQRDIALRVLSVATEVYFQLVAECGGTDHILMALVAQPNGTGQSRLRLVLWQMRKALGPRTRQLVDDALLVGALLFLLRPYLGKILAAPGNEPLAEKLAGEFNLTNHQVWVNSLALASVGIELDLSAHDYRADLKALWDQWQDYQARKESGE